MSQKPEKIKKLSTKIINVPSLCEEIINEQIKDNKPIKKEINMYNINKDEILSEIEEKEIKPKKEINKINIIENIIPSNNLDLNKPRYVLPILQQNQYKLLLEPINKIQTTLNPISITPLDKDITPSMKYLVEKPKVYKEFKIDNNQDNKKEDNLPSIGFNDYLIPKSDKVEYIE